MVQYLLRAVPVTEAMQVIRGLGRAVGTHAMLCHVVSCAGPLFSTQDAGIVATFLPAGGLGCASLRVRVRDVGVEGCESILVGALPQ